MNPSELLKIHREEVLRIAEKHGARNVRVFGSVARGEDTEDSDIDFLVEMEKGRSLMDRAGLKVDLEQLLGCEVDVATERVLKPRIREHVIKEAVLL